jgi:hypothetical protein
MLRVTMPMTPTEKVRRHRQRQAEGLVCYPVPLDAKILGSLVSLGYLTERDIYDPTRVGDAAFARLRDTT